MASFKWKTSIKPVTPVCTSSCSQLCSKTTAIGQPCHDWHLIIRVQSTNSCYFLSNDDGLHCDCDCVIEIVNDCHVQCLPSHGCTPSHPSQHVRLLHWHDIQYSKTHHWCMVFINFSNFCEVKCEDMNIDISVFASILHCQSELVTDTINTRFCFVHTYAEMFTCAGTGQRLQLFQIWSDVKFFTVLFLRFKNAGIICKNIMKFKPAKDRLL